MILKKEEEEEWSGDLGSWPECVICRGVIMVEDFDNEGRRPGENIRACPVDTLVPVKLGNETPDFCVYSGATLSEVTCCKGLVRKVPEQIFWAAGK